MAQPEGDTDPGQRLDPASPAGWRTGRRSTGCSGPTPCGSPCCAATRTSSSTAARCGPSAARRRSPRSQPHRPRQARDQVPSRAVTGDGVPVAACAATAANVNGTLLFERLFLTAFAVVARIGTVFADKGYDAEQHHRELGRAFGAEPHLHKRGRPYGSGLGKRRALAGRARQRLAAREQTPGAALRPPRFHRPVPAPGRLSLPGCRTPRSGIVTTASYAEGMARGGVLVAAQVEDHRVERVAAAYREYGAADLDVREAKWRAEDSAD